MFVAATMASDTQRQDIITSEARDAVCGDGGRVPVTTLSWVRNQTASGLGHTVHTASAITYSKPARTHARERIDSGANPNRTWMVLPLEPWN